MTEILMALTRRSFNSGYKIVEPDVDVKHEDLDIGIEIV